MLDLFFNLFYVLLLLPYLTLGIKDLSLSIKLLFTTLAEMGILAIALTLINYVTNNAFAAILYASVVLAELIIILNILVIIAIWTYKKINKIINY